ncbi:DUF6445 family protein [Psychrosphaera algicola]|uniref:DUF6445 family protein n=1 Tax=Psychrosphaera algicola TaxID=3023714 RepID=A0ABT5FJC7_9GAMM|nr:DUF6445 family protein [Psychrosphaera sp. G1-22]MDC2891281.1 DUF6445 family protein [Psychrosphaera sp. G1-22]
MYDINRKQRQVAQNIGHEQTPIFVVDDVLLDPSAAIANGVTADYGTSMVQGTYYPGVRANVGAEYGMAILQFAAHILYRHFQVPKELTLYPRNGCFSLLTQRPADLNLLSCIPHFDNNETFSFAILHYLNPSEFGGTSFYRHKPTGFENVTQARRKQYLQAAQQHINQHGNPKQQYVTGTDPHFELIHTVDYKPNRLVIYPATILHSAHIEKPNVDVNPDPKSGRLTANFFVDFQP